MVPDTFDYSTFDFRLDEQAAFEQDTGQDEGREQSLSLYKATSTHQINLFYMVWSDQDAVTRYNFVSEV
jgi:hypothetical protein